MLTDSAIIVAQAFVAAAGIGAMLFTLAARLGFDVELYKLRRDTRLLRLQYEQRVAELRSIGGSIDRDGPSAS